MKTAVVSILWAVAGYFVGLFGCIWLLPFVSGNRHDVGLESIMTGAFFIGPVLAVAGFVVGFTFQHKRSARKNLGPDTVVDRDNGDDR